MALGSYYKRMESVQRVLGAVTFSFLKICSKRRVAKLPKLMPKNYVRNVPYFVLVANMR
jgi:hypothetical protein